MTIGLRVLVTSLVALGTGCNERCHQVIDDNTQMSGSVTYLSPTADPIQAEAIEDSAAVYFGGGYVRLGWTHGTRLLALTIDRTPEQPGTYDLSTLEARLCECDKDSVSTNNCFAESAQYCLPVAGRVEIRELSNVCEERCASTIDITVQASLSDEDTQFSATLNISQHQSFGESCAACDAVICDD